MILHLASTPNGLKPLLMLEELGLPYELRRVDLGRNEQKQPDFLALNPNGRIPVLQDGAQVVFESGAILLWLAEKTGRFWAASGPERVEGLEWLMFQMSAVGPMMGQFNHFKNHAPETLPYAIGRYEAESRRILGVLDTRLSQAPYLARDYGVADIATWPWVRDLGRFGLVAGDWPHLARWIDQIGARPAARRAVEILYGG